MDPPLLLLALFACVTVAKSQYTPDWPSIDSRPIPQWYDGSKIGIFIHFGVFSVPSFGSEWFWTYWASNYSDYVQFMKNQYPPSFTYQDFAPDFDAYFYNPNWWADLIQDSGAKYVVITSKHHEGFTNWPSNVSFSWNSVDVGPKRDIIGEFATAIRNRTKVHFGLYHSLYEWYNPLYDQDKANNFTTGRFVQFKTMPEMYELINTYQPELLWSDGDWEAPDVYWNSTSFLAWLYNSSPVKKTIVTNDRWGSDSMCKHGGYWTCQDRYNPGYVIPRKWENCYTLDKQSWGYRREGALKDYLTELEVVTVLAQTVSCGGNLLLNIGPRKDGTIDPVMEERLRQMGRWLRINGEAIYETQPWIFQNETHIPVWYTARQTMKGDPYSAVTVYATVLAWPVNDKGYLYLTRLTPTDGTTVTMLGYSGGLLPWHLAGIESGIVVDFSHIPFAEMPSLVAWVLRIDGLAPHQQAIHPLVKKNYIFQ